ARIAQRCGTGMVELFAMPAPALAPAEPGQDGDLAFSETNIQEPGVDEADVVKTDGVYLYVLAGGELHVVRAQPASSLSEVSAVPVPGEPEAMYLYDSLAVVLSSTQGLEGEELAFAGDRQTAVTVIDVADAASPVVLKTIVLDGRLHSSRRIGSKLRLIVVMRTNAAGREAAASTLDDWLPKRCIRGPDGVVDFGAMAGYGDFYRPIVPDGLGITSVVSVDLDDLEAEPKTVAVVGDAAVIYASRQALYLTDAEYGYDGRSRQMTVVHKFDLSGEAVQYVGSGSVEGRVLNQFSLGEKDGYLRIATTTGWFGGAGQVGLRNHVYVLGQGQQELVVVGSIEDIAPGETLYAARFVGSRGFLVTFEKVDPLFVLDLSDPENPRLVGQLEVPGYAEYVHPVGQDYLIAIGKDAETVEGVTWFQGVQLALFDVSNLEAPQLLDRVVLGSRGTESEALNDHHAFNYFAEQDVLAVPICLAEGGLGGPDYGVATFEGLYVYHVTPQEGFQLAGRISTHELAWPYCNQWGSWTRGVFIGSDVFAITPDGVWASPLSGVGSVVWSMRFE
ncbi:MAG: beta-propeller domain-containing protein, partial [Phycisphaerae bacterium]